MWSIQFEYAFEINETNNNKKITQNCVSHICAVLCFCHTNFTTISIWLWIGYGQEHLWNGFMREKKATDTTYEEKNHKQTEIEMNREKAYEARLHAILNKVQSATIINSTFWICHIFTIFISNFPNQAALCRAFFPLMSFHCSIYSLMNRNFIQIVIN